MAWQAILPVLAEVLGGSLTQQAAAAAARAAATPAAAGQAAGASSAAAGAAAGQAGSGAAGQAAASATKAPGVDLAGIAGELLQLLGGSHGTASQAAGNAAAAQQPHAPAQAAPPPAGGQPQQPQPAPAAPPPPQPPGGQPPGPQQPAPQPAPGGGQPPPNVVNQAVNQAAQQAAARIANQLIASGVGAATAMGTSLAASAFTGGGPSAPPQGRVEVSASHAANLAGMGPAGQRMVSTIEGRAGSIIGRNPASRQLRGFAGVADRVMSINPVYTAMKDASESAKELADTLIRLPGMIEDWGEELKQSRQHLVAFNGTIAQAFGESERRAMERSVVEGRHTGATTAMLTDALDDFRDTLEPLRSLRSNALNIVATAAVRGADAAVKILSSMSVLVQIATWAQEKFGGLGINDRPPFLELMQALHGDPKRQPLHNPLVKPVKKRN